MTPHIPYCFYINLTSVGRRLPLLFYRLRSYGLKRISISFRVTKTLKGRAEMHIRSCDTKFRELFLVCFFFKFHHVMGVEFQFSIYLVGCFEDKVAFHVCFTLFYDIKGFTQKDSPSLFGFTLLFTQAKQIQCFFHKQMGKSIQLHFDFRILNPPNQQKIQLLFFFHQNSVI